MVPVKQMVPVRPALAALPNELLDNNCGNYNDNYAVDARSTHTLNWARVRNAESHDSSHQTGDELVATARGNKRFMVESRAALREWL